MDWYYAEGENRIGPVSDERFRGLINGGTITDETLVWHEGMDEWVPYTFAVSGLAFGGFWVRFVAKLIDNFIVGISGLVVQIPLLLIFGVLGSSNNSVAILGSMLSVLASIGLPAAYSTWFIGRFGATPGKMALGLKVVRSDGASVTYGRAFARYVSEFLSALILLIGYIIAAFDIEKRTLHDHLCDTRVIVSRR